MAMLTERNHDPPPSRVTCGPPSAAGKVEARRSAQARLLIMTTDNMDTKTMGDDYKDPDGEMEMTKTKTLGDEMKVFVSCNISVCPKTVLSLSLTVQQHSNKAKTHKQQ